MKSGFIYLAIATVVLTGCGTDHQREKQSARHELQRGADALQQGSPQAALSHLSASLANDPSAEAYLLRSEIQLDPSRFRRALEDAEAGLKLDPHNRQLRQVRDLAAAHLKLAMGEASIVDNSRYNSEEKSARLQSAVLEQLSFGDEAEQKQVFRELVERNPFWKNGPGVQREAYIQEFLELDDEFLPLAISYEQGRLAKDESIERAIRDYDLEVLGDFISTRQIFSSGLALGDVARDGRLLLSAEQRSAILQDAEKSGINVLEMVRFVRRSAVPCFTPTLACRPWTGIVIGTEAFPEWTKRSTDRWRCVNVSEHLTRRLSWDYPIGNPK